MLSCIECEFTYDESEENCPRCSEIENQERPKLIAISAMTTQFITQADELEAKLGNLWPENDEVSFKLITEVERKFKSKNKYHSYFSENNGLNSAPVILKKYVKGDVNFSRLVEKFMKSLISAARDVGARKITGGNIVFMHYKTFGDSEDIGRLLAIWVTKKDGFNFDEVNLLPKDTSHLNLDAMRQAALFDLTLFNDLYPNIPSTDTYLKFIQGASTGEFFKIAFGCDIKNVGNVDSVNNLRQAISDFQDKHDLSNDFYTNASDKVEVMLCKAQKSGMPISLPDLCDAVNDEVPIGSIVRGTFSSFINSNGYEINHHIEPTLNSVKAGQSIDLIAKDKSFTAKILKKQIGSVGSGQVVEYEDGRLTFIISDEKQKNALLKLASANSENE